MSKAERKTKKAYNFKVLMMSAKMKESCMQLLEYRESWFEKRDIRPAGVALNQPGPSGTSFLCVLGSPYMCCR